MNKNLELRELLDSSLVSRYHTHPRMGRQGFQVGSHSYQTAIIYLELCRELGLTRLEPELVNKYLVVVLLHDADEVIIGDLPSMVPAKDKAGIKDIGRDILHKTLLNLANIDTIFFSQDFEVLKKMADNLSGYYEATIAEDFVVQDRFNKYLWDKIEDLSLDGITIGRVQIKKDELISAASLIQTKIKTQENRI